MTDSVGISNAHNGDTGIPTEKKRGSDLVAYLATAKSSGLNQSEIARAAGWVTSTGRVDVNGMLTEFAKTTLELPRDTGLRGKTPAYEVGISKTGSVIISGAYTRQLGWDKFERVAIKVDKDGKKIVLELKD